MRLSVRTMTLLWVFAFAFLGARMTDVHVHLCFDGQEPAATFHAGDSRNHHGQQDSDGAHKDKDVDYATAAPVKKSGDGAADQPLLTALAIAIILPVQRTVTRLRFVQVLPHLSRYRFQPPQRGPPR